MAGAYVAKPDVYDPPDLPPGWNPNWTFPGPSPPGYVPDYSLSIEAPSSVGVGGAIEVSATLLDYSTYRTRQPAGGACIVWSATVDDVEIPLRFGTEGDYTGSVLSAYTNSDDFWGAAPTLSFELTAEHDGKTLVLRAFSEVLDVIIDESNEIVVDDNVIFHGHAKLSSGAHAAGATVVVKKVIPGPGFVEIGSDITDSSGNWEVKVACSEIGDAVGIQFIATLAGGYEEQEGGSSVPEAPGRYEQDEIVFPSLRSVVIAFLVTCSESPPVLDGAVGRVYADWGSTPKVGFAWSGETEEWSHEDGSGAFVLTPTGDNEGEVHIDQDDWDALVAGDDNTMSVYAYVRGEEGQQCTVGATLSYYIDGLLSGTYECNVVATVPGPYPDDTDSGVTHWVQLNEDYTITDLTL